MWNANNLVQNLNSSRWIHSNGDNCDATSAFYTIKHNAKLIFTIVEDAQRIELSSEALFGKFNSLTKLSRWHV